MALTVALLGAESTGKTTVARDLGRMLAGEGRRVAVVPEYLREFCDTRGRTPHADEQSGIAREQTRRIDAAAVCHDIVIADTTALMTAVYSDLLFNDLTLYPAALDALRGCGLVLVTAVDLPWQADGLQRDGPHARGPVNRLLRAALVQGAVDHAIVSGDGDARLACALVAVRHALSTPDAVREAKVNPRWQWACDRCSDGDCERHVLEPPRRFAPAPQGGANGRPGDPGSVVA